MHFFHRPVVSCLVLHPLEIGHRDSARVGQDVRNHHRALLVEDRVGVRRRRAVGELEDDRRLDPGRVGFGDLVLYRGGDQHVALRLQQLRVVQLPRGAVGGGAGDVSGGFLVFHHLVGIHAVGVVDGRGRVREADDAVAVVVEQARAVKRGVAESLEHDPGSVGADPEFLLQVPQDVEAAPAGGVVASERASQRHRLAGDDGGARMARDGAVLVRHPGHDDAVGVHVGGGDVALGSDEARERFDVDAAQALQLGPGQCLDVHRHAPLGAAERQVHHRALERHPERQRHDLVHVHRRVEADAALGGAAGVVVAAAPRLERLARAVVHAHQQRGGQRLLGITELVDDFALDVEIAGGVFEALPGGGKEIRGHGLLLLPSL